MATIVDFSTGVNEKIAEPLWQWDYGQTLIIKGIENVQVVQVHFCDRSCTEAIVRIGTLVDDEIEVAIPDSLLENEWDINAFVYICGEGCGQTIKHVQIPVLKRKKPGDYEPIPPSVQTELDKMIATVNATTETNKELVAESATQVTKIAGYCDGIKEVERAFTEITITEQRASLSTGKKYKIVDNATGWNLEINYVFAINNKGTITDKTVTFTLPTFDPAKPYVFFKLVSAELYTGSSGGVETAIKLVYEINGEQHTYTYDTYDLNYLIEFKDDPCYVIDATKVYEVDEEAGVILKTNTVFIKYADDAQGTNMTDTYTNQEYMGTYVGKEASTSASDYTWVKIVGGKALMFNSLEDIGYTEPTGDLNLSVFSNYCSNFPYGARCALTINQISETKYPKFYAAVLSDLPVEVDDDPTVYSLEIVNTFDSNGCGEVTFIARYSTMTGTVCLEYYNSTWNKVYPNASTDYVDQAIDTAINAAITGEY